MKKLFSSFIVISIMFMGVFAYAYEYTDAQKNAFYDLFLASYFAAAEKQVGLYPVTAQQKKQIVNYIKQNANKQTLMNETWHCVKTKNPTDQIGINSCFIPWSQKQGKLLSEYVIRLTSY